MASVALKKNTSKRRIKKVPVKPVPRSGTRFWSIPTAHSPPQGRLYSYLSISSHDSDCGEWRCFWGPRHRGLGPVSGGEWPVSDRSPASKCGTTRPQVRRLSEGVALSSSKAQQ
ncbi:hypothetical protein DPEC_G00291690 [Dallia pectoralis]|uniref:Uncharacterized protein n=1 Tax=Dallia pectoralis TaxID=75939 RepID=A0ACC2FI18_DALPE|nr:hypothetical protein DPEC_G00291690 [Dallia pectoralis]